jgi:hypothetical protein
MKDLSILSEHLRATAKADGPDFAWPLDVAAEVIQALVDAGAVVLGVEAWLLDAEGVPAVVGWSSYELGDCLSDWEGSVVRSKAEADSVLAGIIETAAQEQVNYVGIDWAFPIDIENTQEWNLGS